MSGDGGGSDASNDIEYQADKNNRISEAYSQAAKSMRSEGVRNLSGQDRTNRDSGRSSSTVSSSSRGRAQGTNSSTSGNNSYSERNDNGRDDFGFGPGLLSGTPLSQQTGLAGIASTPSASSASVFNPVPSASRPSQLTPLGISGAHTVSTKTALTNPFGTERQATDRAMRFSDGPVSVLGGGDFSHPSGRSRSEIERYAYDSFRREGYSHQQAAGVLGNIEVESAFNPEILGDGGHAHGLFQHNDRAQDLKNFAKRRGKSWKDPYVQIDFALEELKTTEKRAARALKKAKTANQAAKVFSDKFERPGTPHMSRRQAAARRFDSKYLDRGVPSEGGFSGELNVALVDDGEVLNPIDRPGSIHFTDGKFSDVDIPNSDGMPPAQASFRAAELNRQPTRFETDQAVATNDTSQGTTSLPEVERLEVNYLSAGQVRSEQLAEQARIANTSYQTATNATPPRPVPTEDVLITGADPTRKSDEFSGNATLDGVELLDVEKTKEEKKLNPIARTVIKNGVDIGTALIPGIGPVIGLANGASQLLGLGSLGGFFTDNIEYSMNNPVERVDGEIPYSQQNKGEQIFFPASQRIDQYLTPAEPLAPTTASPTIHAPVDDGVWRPKPHERWGAQAWRYR